MSKRKQLDVHSVTDTIIIPDLRSAHHFLSPYDYSSATIGIQNYLLRYDDSEHFIKFAHQGVKPEDFKIQLNDKEKTLKNICYLDIERAAMIARLRKYLEQNDGSFQDILTEIQCHRDQAMQEDRSLSLPKTNIEFIQQCKERNKDAVKLQQIHRRRRFQFYENNNVKQPMNTINLQNRILTHFQIIYHTIKKSPDRTCLIPYLETLLNNSFFIIKHPSPPVATHSSGNKDHVTAKVYCRLLCVLDRSNPAITIDNITPFVRRLTTYYQAEEPDTVYQQPQMSWKNSSVITTSKNYKAFSCADLLEISLKQTSTASRNQRSLTGRTHYAPFVYRIDFCIKVTVRFPNDSLPYQQCVIVQSAPFGLISNTSQEEDLFARVFIEDLKIWKSLLSTIVDNITSPPPPTNLTIAEIAESIEGYFIHKTGIRPKDWIMPYISNVLIAACQNQPDFIESLCHNYLVKILAQIDYMAKHPLLSLFHADGLFLAICDSDIVYERLRTQLEYCQKSICAVRFGAIDRMSDPKDMGVRVNLIEKSSPGLQKYTFDTTKLSFELGLYIIKIALCEASHFNSILTNFEENDPNSLADITKFVELYHSEKLLEICPHKERYTSIWSHFYNTENNDSKNPSLSSVQCPLTNYTITTTTANIDNSNSPYNPWNSNQYAIDQTQSYHHQPSSLQPQFLGTLSNVPQYSITPPINQTSNNTPPIIIVVASPNQYIMSNQDLALLIQNHLPQYSQLIHLSPFHRIDADQTIPSNPLFSDDFLDLFNN